MRNYPNASRETPYSLSKSLQKVGMDLHMCIKLEIIYKAFYHNRMKRHLKKRALQR